MTERRCLAGFAPALAAVLLVGTGWAAGAATPPADGPRDPGCEVIGVAPEPVQLALSTPGSGSPRPAPSGAGMEIGALVRQGEAELAAVGCGGARRAPGGGSAGRDSGDPARIAAAQVAVPRTLIAETLCRTGSTGSKKTGPLSLLSRLA